MKITQSSLAVFSECPRKYHYKYVQKKERVSDSTALQFGRAMHSALDLLWSKGIEEAVEWLKEHATGLEWDEAVKLAALLQCYEMPQGYRVVSTETEFTWRPPGTRGLRLVGKCDAIAVKDDGRTWLVEHKTTSDKIVGWGDYWRRLAIDHQILSYCLAMDIRHVLYNVIKKPGIRPRNGEGADAFMARCVSTIMAAQEEHYQLREIHFTDGELEAALNDIKQRVGILRYSINKDHFPRSSNACRGIYGTCPFLGVCSGRDDINDQSLFRDKSTQHEELQNG